MGLRTIFHITAIGNHGITIFRILPVITIVTLICFFVVILMPAFAADRPKLTLAKKYSADIDLAQYRVSEKLDGVRAYWDGEKLLSRNGNPFAVPAWFVADFPKIALDGELWGGRGNFQKTVSVVTRDTPHKGWQAIQYMVFDLPDDDGDFDSVLEKLQVLKAATANDYLQIVAYETVPDHRTLMEKLDTVITNNGEGLILRRGAGKYKSGRTDDFLKLKKLDDAEAIVVAHNPGKGKFTGMLGSITARTVTRGIMFRIGTGFTHAERQDPPPVGATITFKHQGLTDSGKPRFPVFWRIRSDEPLQ